MSNNCARQAGRPLLIIAIAFPILAGCGDDSGGGPPTNLAGSIEYSETYQARTDLNWGGLQWSAKNGVHGPRMNKFGALLPYEQDGLLHLPIRKNVAGDWIVSEVKSDQSFGYGRFEFVIAGIRVISQTGSDYYDDLITDPLAVNVVAGLFLYGNTSELDTAELSAAFGPGTVFNTIHYAVDTANPTSKTVPPPYTIPALGLTISMEWTPSKIAFSIKDANGVDCGSREYVGDGGSFPVPVPDEHHLLLNFWIAKPNVNDQWIDVTPSGDPNDSNDYEFVVKNFTYVPYPAIAGLVTDATTGLPVSNASIAISGPQSASAITSPDGKYEIPGILSGSYTVSTQKSGYQSSQTSTDILPGQVIYLNQQLSPVASNPPPDTMPPAISITNPTTAGSFSTSSSSITLGGTASDNVAVTSVTWSNGATGGSGTATGTTSWSASVPLVPGSNLVSVKAFDAAGNNATATITVTYAPPAIAITSPSSGTTIYTQTKTVAGTATGLSTVHVWVYTDQWYYQGVAAVNSSGVWSLTIYIGPSTITSPMTATVKANDSSSTSAGNTNSNTITITRKPPAIAITSPSSGTTIYAQTVTIYGTATPGIATVHLWVYTDQWYYQGAVSPNSSGNWSGTVYIGPSGTITSPITATVKADDSSSSSSGTVNSNTITITRNPPTIAITSPSSGTTIYTQTKTVAGTATGFSTVHVWVYTDQWYYQGAASVNSSGAWSLTVYIGPPTITSTITATVKANNSATSSTGTINSSTITIYRSP